MVDDDDDDDCLMLVTDCLTTFVEDDDDEDILDDELAEKLELDFPEKVAAEELVAEVCSTTLDDPVCD
jgi:hypothetical protein